MRSEKAEKPLDRLQSEVMSVSERLALFAHVMDGSAFLLVPAAEENDRCLGGAAGVRSIL